MDRIGVADTMFARYDMGAEAVDELESCPGYGERFEIVRRTVPGFKDLGVACKKLIEEDGCRIVVALGMPGKAAIDQVCAHEASQGIMLAQLLTNTHVLEVFVHENEEEDPERLAAVCVDRSRKHARNAYWLLYDPDAARQATGRASARVTPTPAADPVRVRSDRARADPSPGFGALNRGPSRALSRLTASLRSIACSAKRRASGPKLERFERQPPFSDSATVPDSSVGSGSGPSPRTRRREDCPTPSRPRSPRAPRGSSMHQAWTTFRLETGRPADTSRHHDLFRILAELLACPRWRPSRSSTDSSRRGPSPSSTALLPPGLAEIVSPDRHVLWLPGLERCHLDGAVAPPV